MANYAKRWTPPVKAPSGITVTAQMLTDWITVMEDIDAHMVEAGLTRSVTEGQLVIDEVSVYPAIDTFAGFKEYLWGDDVTIRLDMGVGNDGKNSASSSSYTNRVCNTPYIALTVTHSGMTRTSYHPAQITSTNTTTAVLDIPHIGDMTCAVNTGDMFAFMYQCNSRGKLNVNSTGSGSANNTYGAYRGATLAFILRRVDDGVIVITHALTSGGTIDDMRNTTDTQTGSYVALLSNEGVPISNLQQAIGRMGNVGVSQMYGDNLLLQRLHYIDNKGRYQPIPDVLSYVTTDLPTGAEISIPVEGGSRKYLCLGNGNTMGAYNHGTYSALAILFEGDDD